MVQKIAIQECKSVSDLLEESRLRLEFEKHDQLSAHEIPHGKCIDDTARIRDIAHLTTIVIRRTETRAIREDAATRKKHGLASISVKQNGNRKEIRQRSDLPQSETRRRRDNTARAGTKYGSKQDEIFILNIKLEVHSTPELEGFVYKIVPEECTHVNTRKESMSTSFSWNEDEEKQSKIRVIPSWSNWQLRNELPCWGVRINNNVGKNNPSECELHRNKNRETSGIHTVIVRKTCFYPVREFRVNVTINEEAVKEAKRILEIKKKRGKQQAVKEFKDKYCSFVYSGNFCAGASLETVADAYCFKRPSDSTDVLMTLERCALEETEYYWSSKIQEDRSLSCQFPKNKNPNVNVHVFKTSKPPRIQNMLHLQETIREVRNCTVFPANWDDKSYFTPVYKIMQSQAEASKDEDLRKVSAIFKEYMEGKTAFFIFGLLVGIVCDGLQDKVSYSPPNLLLFQ